MAAKLKPLGVPKEDATRPVIAEAENEEESLLHQSSGLQPSD